MSDKYLLTFKVPIKAFDDLEARMMARNIVASVSQISMGENVEVKFQKVFEDKQPEKLEL